MKNQVLSIEQMQKLKELGVDTSKASMHFLYMPTAKSIMSGVYEVDDEPEVFVSQNGMNHEHPTFTLQDIIELLPYTFDNSYLRIYRGINMYYFIYESINSEDDIIEKGNTPLLAAYNMLIWVAENGYLKTK